MHRRSLCHRPPVVSCVAVFAGQHSSRGSSATGTPMAMTVEALAAVVFVCCQVERPSQLRRLTRTANCTACKHVGCTQSCNCNGLYPDLYRLVLGWTWVTFEAQRLQLQSQLWCKWFPRLQLCWHHEASASLVSSSTSSTSISCTWHSCLTANYLVCKVHD